MSKKAKQEQWRRELIANTEDEEDLVDAEKFTTALIEGRPLPKSKREEAEEIEAKRMAMENPA